MAYPPLPLISALSLSKNPSPLRFLPFQGIHLQELTPALRAEIDRLVAPDLVVYRHAQSLFKARADAHGEVSGKFSAQIDELQQAVERLRYEQRLGLAARDKWLDEIKSNLA